MIHQPPLCDQQAIYSAASVAHSPPLDCSSEW